MMYKTTVLTFVFAPRLPFLGIVFFQLEQDVLYILEDLKLCQGIVGNDKWNAEKLKHAWFIVVVNRTAIYFERTNIKLDVDL